jgi:glucose-6-phosphate-specific signal transduction histidine kinase
LTFLQLALTGVVCKIKIKNQGRMNNHLKKEIVTEKNYEEKRKRKPRRNTKREMQRE